MTGVGGDILRMLNSGELLRIPMPYSNQRQVAGEPKFSRFKLKGISETDYAETYKKKDDEEYLMVIHTFNVICIYNNVTKYRFHN